jgi:hypothetical protein
LAVDAFEQGGDRSRQAQRGARVAIDPAQVAMVADR